MKALVLSIVTASLVLAPVAAAKSKSDSSSRQRATLLHKALASAAVSASGPAAKTDDRDQGDDHANAGAILRVCSKDTPAARRSAICPIGVSPQ